VTDRRRGDDSGAAVRLAVLDDWEGVAEDLIDWPKALPEATISFFTDHLADPRELVQRLEPFDIVMVMRERTRLPAQMLWALPRLRLLVTTGMRNRVIDLDAAREAGVTVCGTQGLQWAAPELTWGLILAVARQIPRADVSMHAGRWEPSVGMDLHGSVLGLVGLGKLGGQVATVGRAFGMELVAWSPHLTEERAAAHGARLVDKQDLFATADVVSIHMILAASTRGLVGATEIDAMKPTAILVNTSRGPLVDEAALIGALHAGRIAGAGIDVYDQEPLPADHTLRSTPGLVMTPHLGYVTRDTFDAFYHDAVGDIRAFLDGNPIRVISG
jgi:phosphoglycerate dehydrogenase-like enzyme